MTTAVINAKKTLPWVPVGHPDFVWTTGADVQKTWRRYGWVAPSEGKPAPLIVEKHAEYEQPVRRVK